MNQNRKPVILIICNYYLPGYKAGGGLRTLVHTVERFSGKFDFRVLTFNHDVDKKNYDSVKPNDWNDVGGAKVFYISENNLKFTTLRQIIRTVNPDSIYLNSVFSKLTIYTLILRKLNGIANIRIILAPEGELSDGALQLKSSKKKIFTKIAQRADLYRNLMWKVTTDLEKKDVERFRNKHETIYIAPNIPAKYLLSEYRQELKPTKNSGEAKIVFLSRIMKTKNINWLLDNLKKIKGKLEIDIYGPIENEEYFEETKRKIEKLPENIKVIYKGSLIYEDVLKTLFKYHFFVLPTLGENFGHIFIEALAAGCPLIISDKTPWLNLEEKKIGWDISLRKPDEWNKIINYCISLNKADYSELSVSARNFANKWLSSPEIEENTLKVLNHSLKQSSKAE